MHQSRFEEEHRAEWERFAEMLDSMRPRPFFGKKEPLPAQLPQLYRRVCSHYSLALRRCYTSALTERLHSLVLRGHRHVYQRRGQGLRDIFFFFHTLLPQAVRRARGFVFLSLALFLLPGLVVGVLSFRSPTFIHSLMPAAEVEKMEQMYDPGAESASRTIQRSEEGDFAMFGHYIHNNISISFRVFAGGALFGIGTVMALLYNGLVIGAVAGHLSHPPFAGAFWPFVAGHSAWELTAIVLSGAAGLMLGNALLRPGPYRRLDALRRTAPAALQLVLGATLMLTVAAVIEAFWSARPLADAIKYGFSLVNWTVVILYFFLSGRGRHAA